MKRILAKAATASATIAALSLLAAQTVSANGYYDYTYTPATDAAAGAAGLGFFAIWCCALLVPAIILIALAYYVYKDAKKNNVENGPLWALLTLFTGLIGLLIYLLAIKPEALKKQGVTSTPAPKAEEKKSKE